VLVCCAVRSHRQSLSFPALQETGGRVRLASDKSIVVTVNGHGLLSAWQLLDEKVVSFWTRIARHPTALNSAIRCVPSFELVLYGSSPSGRSVTAHASASDNFVLLSTLLGTSSSAGTAAGRLAAAFFALTALAGMLLTTHSRTAMPSLLSCF
jgi:hypothetical protein